MCSTLEKCRALPMEEIGRRIGKAGVQVRRWIDAGLLEIVATAKSRSGRPAKLVCLEAAMKVSEAKDRNNTRNRASQVAEAAAEERALGIPPEGNPMGQGEFARRYAPQTGITHQVLSTWAKAGKIPVLLRPVFPGDKTLIDERITWDYMMQNYKPRRKKGRRSVAQAGTPAHPSTPPRPSTQPPAPPIHPTPRSQLTRPNGTYRCPECGAKWITDPASR